MIALTGGAGAMGLRLARRLRAQGETVVLLDLAESAEKARAEGFPFRTCDIRRPEDLAEALVGARAVVHLAALLLAREDAPLLDAVNHRGTTNVLLAAKRAGIRRFVHVSSISVTYARQNAYSRSKASAEDAVRRSELDWTILRPTLAWGDPGAAEHERFARAVASWPLLPLPGGGSARKSPVHVDDLARAFATCLETPEAIGRTLTLSGPRAITLREMARDLRLARGRRGATLPIPVALAGLLAGGGGFLRRRFGVPTPIDWQTFTGLVEDAAPSCEPASELLGWTPRPWSPLP